NGLARTLQTAGDYPRAGALYERARLVDLTLSRDNAELGDETLRGLRRASRKGVTDYVTLLATLPGNPSGGSQRMSAWPPAFRAREQTGEGGAQAALNRAGARALAGTAEAASLARQVDELGHRRAAMRKLVQEEHGRPAEERSSDRLAVLEQETR